MKKKGVFYLFKESFAKWLDDKAPQMGAALSFYSIFSIIPLIILVISIGSIFLEAQSVQQHVFGQLQGIIGKQGTASIQQIVQNSQSYSKTGIIIGAAFLIIGASGVFSQLQSSLNYIFRVTQRKSQKGWKSIKDLITKRFLTFGMVLAIGFLLIISLIVSSILSALGSEIQNLLNLSLPLEIIDLAVSILVISMLFALIFKVLPDDEFSWKDVWIGSFVTGILFSAGKYLIGLYLSKSDIASGFGAASFLVILLLWIYYSSQILFMGAEITYVYSKNFGSLKNKK